jgi:hypothetical protein
MSDGTKRRKLQDARAVDFFTNDGYTISVGQIALVRSHRLHKMPTECDAESPAQDYHLVGRGHSDDLQKDVTFKTMPGAVYCAQVGALMGAQCFKYLATACAVPHFVAAGSMRVAVLMTTVRGIPLDELVLRATDGCATSIETLCRVAKNGMGAVDFDHCWSPTMYNRAPCFAKSDNDDHIPDYDCCPLVATMPPSALLIWRFIHTLVLDIGSQKPTLFGKNAAMKAHAQQLLGLGDDRDIFDAPPYYPYQSHEYRVATGDELVQYVKGLHRQTDSKESIDSVRTRDAWAALLMRLADVARVCDARDCMMYMCDAKTANFMV